MTLQAWALTIAAPAGWQPAPAGDDPELVAEFQRGDQDLLVYLQPAEGRSLDGLRVSLRYSIVIDWGGSFQAESRTRLGGVPAISMTFLARTAEQGLRRYERVVAVKGAQKFTVQCSAPPAEFGAAQAALKQLLPTLQWPEEDSSAPDPS